MHNYGAQNFELNLFLYFELNIFLYRVCTHAFGAY